MPVWDPASEKRKPLIFPPGRERLSTKIRDFLIRKHRFTCARFETIVSRYLYRAAASEKYAAQLHSFALRALAGWRRRFVQGRTNTRFKGGLRHCNLKGFVRSLAEVMDMASGLGPQTRGLAGLVGGCHGRGRL